VHCHFCEISGAAQAHENPRDLALSLVSEVGELCEMFPWGKDTSQGLVSWSERERRNLEGKVADIVLVLTRLSQQSGVDLAEAVRHRQDALERTLPSTHPPQHVHPVPPPEAPAPPSPLKLRRTNDEIEGCLPRPMEYTFWDFLRLVQDVNSSRGEKMTEQQFAALNLRFVIMHKGKEHELTQGGKFQPVSLGNKDLFVSLAYDKKTALLAEQGDPDTREIAVDVPNELFDPTKVMAKFSPMHFASPGLFSPHLEARKVIVDYTTQGALKGLPRSLTQTTKPSDDLNDFHLPPWGPSVTKSLTEVMPSLKSSNHSSERLKFSPSHFKVDLFSPFPTAEVVDIVTSLALPPPSGSTALPQTPPQA